MQLFRCLANDALTTWDEQPLSSNVSALAGPSAAATKVRNLICGECGVRLAGPGPEGSGGVSSTCLSLFRSAKLLIDTEAGARGRSALSMAWPTAAACSSIEAIVSLRVQLESP